MNNIALYFRISTVITNKKKYDVIVPVSSMPAALTELFKNEKVQVDNAKNYNEYTQNFIKVNKGTGETFVSKNYEFDSKTKTFQFFNLEVCDDAEYYKIYEFNESFDVNIDHKNNSSIGTLVQQIAAQYPCPTINEGFYVEEKNWKLLVRNIMKHKNTMLIGPTGTGKTELIMKICSSLGLECHIYDMGSMQDPLTDLLGSHRLENGTSVFDYAKFVEDVQKPGVILLDELSRAPLMTNNILFPCLDSRRTLPIEIADSKHDRVIKIHPECTFIATANIGTEYAGTNEIDAALLNRFIPLQLNYLPSVIESQILQVRTGIDKESADAIVSLFAQIRAKYNEGELSKSVSMREGLSCAELVVDGFTILEAMDFVVTGKFLDSSFDSENKKIKKIIMGI